MIMVELRVAEILEEQGKTRYWLSKQLDGMCWRNFSRIVNNETALIRFDTLDRLCKVLNVSVGELFKEVPDEENSES